MRNDFGTSSDDDRPGDHPSMSGHEPAAQRLMQLVAAMRGCRLCVEKPQGAPLPHAPRPVFQLSVSARLLIAGQAPGVRVHASGRPFTDPSGVRLRGWLGMDEATFYDATRVAILPMGLCFPGQDARGADLPPRRECAPAWRDAVMQSLPRLQLVLAVGQYAHAWHVPRHLRGRNLTETVRRWREIFEATDTGGKAAVIPLPHPSWRNNAWLKKNPWFEAQVLPFLRRQVWRVLEET